MRCAFCNRKTEHERRVCDPCRTRLTSSDILERPVAPAAILVHASGPETPLVVVTKYPLHSRPVAFDPSAIIGVLKALFIAALALAALLITIKKLQHPTPAPPTRPVRTVPIPVGSYHITDFRA